MKSANEKESGQGPNDLRTPCTKVSTKDEFINRMAEHYNCIL